MKNRSVDKNSVGAFKELNNCEGRDEGGNKRTTRNEEGPLISDWGVKE